VVTAPPHCEDPTRPRCRPIERFRLSLIVRRSPAADLSHFIRRTAAQFPQNAPANNTGTPRVRWHRATPPDDGSLFVAKCVYSPAQRACLRHRIPAM
jgi:hypothetical protein